MMDPMHPNDVSYCCVQGLGKMLGAKAANRKENTISSTAMLVGGKRRPYRVHRMSEEEHKLE